MTGFQLECGQKAVAGYTIHTHTKSNIHTSADTDMLSDSYGVTQQKSSFTLQQTLTCSVIVMV